MNKKELARRTAALLRESGIRKPVRVPKQTFHISTDDGSCKDFVVRQTDKQVLLTVEDADAVIDACIQVIMDGLKRGEHIAIRGFGSLGLRYRKPRQVKSFATNEFMPVEGRYTPKFTFGENLRACAKIYEANLKDGTIFNSFPSLDNDDEEDGG